MTLPPPQNQYPSWEPPKQDTPQNINNFGAGVPVANGANNTNIPPVQNTQPVQQYQQPQAFDGNQANNLNQVANQPNVGSPKPRRLPKGPLLLLIGVIIIFGVITGVVLLTSKKPTNKQATTTGSQNTKSSAKNDTSKAAPANKDTTKSTDTNSQADDSNQPYEFIDNKQMANLKNLQTSLTTYQSQNTKRQLPPATPQGWALLKASNVIDPVTNKSYAFTASNNSNVGEVQYAAKSICASDDTIIASTDLGSFALRTKLYNGTYYCVDSSNARS